MQEFLEEKGSLLLLGVVILLQLITIALIVVCVPCTGSEESKDNIALVEKDNNVFSPDLDVVENKDKEEVKLKVDVKGAVKKVGVYELNDGARVNDAIKLAGGLKNGASTKYLNLSKKITDEMIIYVYTNTQIKNMEKNDEVKSECVCPTLECEVCSGSNIIVSDKTVLDNNTENVEETTKEEGLNKVSLNTATKEELMTLSGIGESKADAIIQYRLDNGSFKKIEDIMNVSGIGESLYNKIKENITI